MPASHFEKDFSVYFVDKSVYCATPEAFLEQLVSVSQAQSVRLSISADINEIERLLINNEKQQQ